MKKVKNEFYDKKRLLTKQRITLKAKLLIKGQALLSMELVSVVLRKTAFHWTRHESITL